MPEHTLVMIHGLVGSLQYFEPARRISSATVYAWELLGYGDLRDVPLDRLTLQAQVDHVTDRIVEHASPPVWVLGHSMGGAIAVLLAEKRPDLVAGLVNVEGNFTLSDAFWSSTIMAMPLAAWQAKYDHMCNDIPGWLVKCLVAPTPERVEWARHILDWQPARTVHAMSAALVRETQDPAYSAAVRRIIDRGVPLHLIAGEKSAAAWDVPGFVRRGARSYVEIPEVGHLMMLEDPDGFCRVVDESLAASGATSV